MRTHELLHQKLMVMITMEKYRATLSFRVMEISEVFTDRSNDNEVVTDYVDEGSEPLFAFAEIKNQEPWACPPLL